MVSEELADFVKAFGANFPNTFGHFKKGVEEEWELALRAFLQRLDLVTREEFDVQTQLLARMQDKLERLEKKLSSLEKISKHHS